jgi:hypothetical protein
MEDGRKLYNEKFHDFPPHLLLFGWLIKEDLIGSACGMYTEIIVIQGFDGENLRKETTRKI